MRSFAAVALAVAAALASSNVGADARPTGSVRWDIGVAAGVMQRLPSGGDSNAPSPTVGPVAEIHAHVALVPMVRAGPYVAFDLSPVSGRPAREIAEAGLRLKVTPPLLSAPWRTWAFVGVGYARTYAPSRVVATSPLAPSNEASDAIADGVGGGILDVPVGIGLGVRVRGPWVVFAELGGRVGLIFSGAMYRRPQCLCNDPYIGADSFAAALTVGVSWDE